MRNFKLTIIIISIAQISIAQKTGRSISVIHPINEKFCKSSFQTIYIGKENAEENLKNYLSSEIKNLKTKEISLELQHKIVSRGGIHFTYEQFYKGIKIFRSQIKVNMDKSGNIKSVFDNSVELLSSININFSEEDFSFIKNKEGIYIKELIYFPEEKNLVPAMRVEILKEDENYELVYDLSGKIIYTHDLVMYYRKPMIQDSVVTSAIFLPDPLTSANVIYGTPYINANNFDIPELNAQRISVSMKVNYDTVAAVFRLESQYVKITEHSAPNIPPATSATPDFSFTRSQTGFEDVNVFYHINKFQEYIQSLGFSNLANYQLPADAHALNGQDQSSFIPGNPPRLNFGGGNWDGFEDVDDAEDADVIIHEYGHAISYSAAPNTNFGTERSALDEALGDYFASSYSRNINPFKWENVFSWDGHNEFWPGRTSVSNKQYPENLQNNLYTDAEIWSSTMMEIWEDIGRENADALQIQALYSYAANMKMSDAALLILQADSFLNSGAFHAQLCYRFYNRGLEQNNCNTGIEDKNNSYLDFARLLNTENFASGCDNAVLRFKQPVIATICLLDITGNIILMKEINYAAEFFISGKNLAKGMYFLNVTTDNFTRNFKLIKW